MSRSPAHRTARVPAGGALAAALVLAATPAQAAERAPYSGFGGVGLGVVSYANGTVFARGGRSGSPMRVLQSDFLFRVKESSWFVGYGLSIQGGSVFQRTFVPIDGYNDEAESRYVSCYGDVCFGVNEVEYVDVLHVPIETNTAWTFDFWRMTAVIGGGPSLHYYRFRSFESVSAFQLLDGQDPDISQRDAAWLSSANRSSDSEQTRRYALGGQLFGGVLMELGRMPLIGGRWGLSVTGKLQLVRETTYTAKQSFRLTEYSLDGEKDPAFSERRSSNLSVPVNGSSASLRFGLIYFF